MGQDSGLEPSSFQRINDLMTRLFPADGSLILSAEIFLGLDQPERDIYAFPMRSLQASLLFRASQ
ncbi:hypothetical protein XM38_040210 [Halomicronema hongdechloris C2206]|uniref:Uncharacterized protein n=1 Tax=Halomicronema hongdechloris C2206 TaxID=1641165 RepID=A0A1Z3HRX8_9CYAN|nr:hypothetical protein [Halomicronema hongdechloris]ASC73059.1 hypothetical protein XM38_040210 [Halomicronema hongdechloris C2206]